MTRNELASSWALQTAFYRKAGRLSVVFATLLQVRLHCLTYSAAVVDMSQVAHCSVDAQFSWERCEEVFWFNSDIRWPWWRISRWIKWYNCKRGNHKTCKPRLHITRLPPHQTQSIESGRGALVFMSNEMILGGTFIQCCCRTTRPQALAVYFQTFRPSAWALQPLKTASQGLFLSVCVYVWTYVNATPVGDKDVEGCFAFYDLLPTSCVRLCS